MPTMAQWGSKKWAVSSKQVVALEGLAFSYEQVADENTSTEDKLQSDSVVKLNLMRVRVAYEYGRDTGENKSRNKEEGSDRDRGESNGRDKEKSSGKETVYPMKEFITQAHLLEYLKGISTDRADLIRFAHYMEALVAFHRYLGGKEN